MQGKLTNIFKASPENIWNYKQNHPELVIKDMEKYHISQDIQLIVRQSMLCRGINKWLKVRRDLIAYKKQIKHKVKNLQKKVSAYKLLMQEYFCTLQNVIDKKISVDQYYYYENMKKEYIICKELLKVYQQIRGDLKALCMTDRWQIWKEKDLEDMNSIRASD